MLVMQNRHAKSRTIINNQLFSKSQFIVDSDQCNNSVNYGMSSIDLLSSSLENSDAIIQLSSLLIQ